MARADTASASLRSDSIKGLAQSIANPAYRRLLSAEPLLRRAVPVLIVAFMLTICIGAAVQVLDHRRQVVAEATRTIEALADQLAHRTRSPGAERQRLPSPALADMLPRALPDWAAGAGRRVLDRRRRRHDHRQHSGRTDRCTDALILDVLGPWQPLTTFARRCAHHADRAARRRNRAWPRCAP